METEFHPIEVICLQTSAVIHIFLCRLESEIWDNFEISRVLFLSNRLIILQISAAHKVDVPKENMRLTKSPV